MMIQYLNFIRKFSINASYPDTKRISETAKSFSGYRKFSYNFDYFLHKLDHRVKLKKTESVLFFPAIKLRINMYTSSSL